MIPKNGLSQKQAARFWARFGETCFWLGLRDAQAREEYRKRIKCEECGKAHMAELNRTTDFNRLMTCMAVDRGDFQEAAHFAGDGDEKRLAWLIEQCLRQVTELATIETAMKAADGDTFAFRNVGIEYVIAICDRAGFKLLKRDEAYWLDIHKGLLKSLFQMLDTHRRRVMKRVAPGERQLGFVPVARYDLRGGAVEMCDTKPAPESHFKIKVTA